MLALFLCGERAAGQTPTAEQIEMFRNLPPEQQQAILETLGGRSSSGSAVTEEALEGPEAQPPRLQPRKEERPTSETGEPRLIAGDTLIFELKVLRFEDDERALTERAGLPIPGLPDATRMAGTSDQSPQVSAPAGAATRPPVEPQNRGNEIERTPGELQRLNSLMETVRRGNPYRLDRNGAIDLPGLQPIQLAGLTPYEATQRLAIEPFLRDFQLRLTLLPLEQTGADALKPFGYDLFEEAPSTFAPVTDVPVPAEYVVGPGDRFEVQLVGNTKAKYSLVVNRDGRIQFPELGPITVGGLRIPDAKAAIERLVEDKLLGTQVSISMGEVRSIRVFVMGDAERPGSYTVSGLATITSALFASGGVKVVGSLRDIQLKRQGKLITRLDLYDLLLNGDTSADTKLLPGDVIFVPPVGKVVGVSGQIRRPALYELKTETTAAELLRLSGGLTPEADPGLAKIERIDDLRERVVVNADLSRPSGRDFVLRSGDILYVPGVKPTFANAITLDGHVLRPSSYQYQPGLKLADIIVSPTELKPNADQGYVIIRRELPGTRRIQVLSADLRAAWRAPTSTANPLLAARDQIFVFDLETGRRAILDPILDELKLQALSSEPSQIVRVGGHVRVPGDYPLEPNMTVSDLIRAGGGLAEQAYGADAELARYEVRDGQSRKTDVFKIDLTLALAKDASADLVLAPFDFLVVKEISHWSDQETVRLEGEVKFPGEYPIERGETLKAVVARAGGLTQLAFPKGSVFTRDTLKEREKLQLETLADRLKRDLGSLALQAAQGSGTGAQQASETIAIGQTLLADLRSTKPVGRLVIDLDRVLQSQVGGVGDVILKGGDVLRVPKTAQEVTVIGEVQYATSHLYDPDLARDDYLQLSGGTTQKADDKRIYVVRANGSVDASSDSKWFLRSGRHIEPGDTIVVPLDAERMRPLPLWQSVTTILYNLAVSVAAVNSF